MKPDSVDNVIRLSREPVIVPRSEHHISRSAISDNALKVLYRLKNAGYKSYLVGGGVRDLLLNIRPKDFDVVTDARPEQIRELFRNCRLIGRRFRLAHVRFGDEIIEVSTFRAAHHISDGDRHSEDGRIVRDNTYGDIDEDIWRRDFTVNALFYNIQDFSIVDYAGGLDDINRRQLRLIGNPAERYREDPVRMLRAVRFAVKLGFRLHPDTEKSIFENEYLLEGIPSARLYEEFLKLFMGGHSLQAYQLLRKYGLFRFLFPLTSKTLENDNDGLIENFLERVMINSDSRVRDDKPVTPGFIIAALLWKPLNDLVTDYQSNGLHEMDAIQLASDAVISRQVSSIAFPRRITQMARDIWALQSRLKHTKGNKPARLLSHPKFRAGYDFLLLRAENESEVQELAAWWTGFIESNPHLMKNPERTKSHARPRARPGRRRRSR